MDKNTLSNYGWIVMCVLVLAVMIALSSPFSRYIASAFWNTTDGINEVNNNALDVVLKPNTERPNNDLNPELKAKFNKNIFSITKNIKKYNPHKIKFQFAPCQKPVKDHTISIFKICLFNPFLFPPSGIYT